MCIQLSTRPQQNYLQLVTLCFIQFEIFKRVDDVELPLVIPDEDPDFESALQSDTNAQSITVDMEPGNCTAGAGCTPSDVQGRWDNASSCDSQSEKVS